MLTLAQLPALNAGLNALSAACLCAGYLAVRRKNIALHRACMAAAFLSSTVFLFSYLHYHYHAGSVRFQGTGWTRPLYFTVLLSHTVLATAVVPLVLMTLYRALRGRFEAHRTLARWTLPIWLYVSVTGIAVYVMLYHVWRPR